MLLLLLLLLGAATSRCLHDETQKSVSLLRPPFPQPPSNFRSSSLTLPGSHDPQPLRIQTCYVRDPVSDGAWDPEEDSMNGESGVLAAVNEATQRLQGVLAGEWGNRRSQRGLRIRESWGRRPPQEGNWNSKMLRQNEPLALLSASSARTAASESRPCPVLLRCLGRPRYP